MTASRRIATEAHRLRLLAPCDQYLLSLLRTVNAQGYGMVTISRSDDITRRSQICFQETLPLKAEDRFLYRKSTVRKSTLDPVCRAPSLSNGYGAFAAAAMDAALSYAWATVTLRERMPSRNCAAGM